MPSVSEEPRNNQETVDEEQRPRRREPLPQFDWLTEVAIPICVFGLLGSLLYYLIEIRATMAGAFAVGALRWVVFWFLLACIGIARIRTKYGGAAIAGYYSALLAGAIALFMYVYTDRAGALYLSAEQSRTIALIFNWALVGLVWWAASAVTREATLEENVATQLEGGLWSLVADKWQYPDLADREPDEAVDHAGVRPRHPGRLVLWVSLAALLLFAVGQRSVGDQGAHLQLAFACMASYVLFALLLMALTNLSALRMQVRQRGISLAPAVTPAWIVASGIVVIAIVIFSFSVAPRFGTEVHQRVAALPEWISDARDSSMERGPAQGLGDDGEAPGEAERGGAGGQDEAERDAGDEGEGTGADAGEGDEAEEGRGAEDAHSEVDDGDDPGAGEGDGDEDQEADGGERAVAGQDPPQPPHGAQRLIWLLLLAAALAILYFVWLYRRHLIAAARQMARALALIPEQVGRTLSRAWQRLLALLSRLGLPTKPSRASNLPDDPFVDIFARGLADDLEPAEVIRYVYRAFQVYAARAGCERREDQTALEFLRSLPARLMLPDRGAERLTRAYVLATYSPREITEAQVAGAKNTWLQMKERNENTGRQPQNRPKR